MRRLAPLAIVSTLLALALPRPGTALTRREAACQTAIARGGRRFVAAELAARARCLVAGIRGRTCETEDATARHVERLRAALGACRGVTLAELAAGGCAAAAAGRDLDALVACLVERHGQAVEAVLRDQFGDAAP
jgi:hypothetical protein